MFKNRDEAAELLSEALAHYQQKNPLCLGIPRGGVPMAAKIARALRGDLDVILVHKLRAPDQPELAFGSVDESGEIYLSPIAKQLGLDESFIAEEAQRQIEILKQRRQIYTPVRAPIDPKGRVVMVIDDGVATGSTVIAALRALRPKQPAKLIVAVAVAPPDTVKKLRTIADEVVCLEIPTFFYAVGQFFGNFSPVNDDDVIHELRSFYPN